MVQRMMRDFLILLVTISLVGGCTGQSDNNWNGNAAKVEPAWSYLDTVPEAVRTLVQGEIAVGPRIVFLGDSLTRGLGLEPGEAVPALIQGRLEAAGYAYEVVNQGNSGDTSAAGLRRLDVALQGDVGILVLELGANDMLRYLLPEQMHDNLREIIERCLERDIKVLLTGMEALPNLGEAYTTEFRMVFRDLAEEYGLAFMPFLLAGVAGDPMLNQGDMMHPNADGARIVADNLWYILEPMLE
jgi:acyl-CoA thioesterase-1